MSINPDNQNISPEQTPTAGALWTPTRGPEVNRLLDYLGLDDTSRERLVDEASRILSKCAPPNAHSFEPTTGLVLGYVQSGKTMSFTTVATLARDNGYPVVIVVTGVSNPLFDQSTSRLSKDLQLESNRKWRLFKNPRSENRDSINDILSLWHDPSLPDSRRTTALITVLKNTTHLRNLINLLERINLSQMPTLVIDDEADQAGLNTRVTIQEQSITYQRLVALRQRLPHHAYLQYTATPQAPLLINIIDVLSPRFVSLLTPGDDYTGGDVFFNQLPEIVRPIPSSEIPSSGNSLHAPPPTLIEALKLFFLGVAAGYVTGDDQSDSGRLRNRSMLVHPSRETADHSRYFKWIGAIREQWLTVLALPHSEAERIDFVQSFRNAYDDLNTTTPNLPPFDDLIKELNFSIRQTTVLEVNARPVTPQPNWRDSYPWILVGGQAMDRGFTVEGLTVTYMPRDLGVGNADTIEQRARFFGYKRRYIGLCRVFLVGRVRDAFRFYVEHEEDIRSRLRGHQDSGRPLNEWRRAFFLDTTLKPTRRQVLDLDYRQDTISDEWFWPKMPHGSNTLIESNRKIVDNFIISHEWLESLGDSRRTSDQIHLICSHVPLRQVFELLLIQLRWTTERDSQIFTGALLQIEAHIEEFPDEVCTVYRMSGGKSRLRSVDNNFEIPTLFQGANYADGEKRIDMTYQGDDRQRSDQGVTVQLHNLEIRQKGRGTIIANNVPAVAVWIPRSLAQDWLVQNR